MNVFGCELTYSDKQRIREYIENEINIRNKGIHSLMQSRSKWKRRYYNLRRKQKEDINAIKNVFTEEDIDRIVAKSKETQRKAEKYDKLIEMLEEEITYKNNVEIGEKRVRRVLFELLYKKEIVAGITLVNAYRKELLTEVEEE